MAQASSAQREPSMEEILASIRRIIEDSDGDKNREADSVSPLLAAPANDASEAFKTVETFRAEFRDAAPADVAPPVEPPSARTAEPVYLHDVTSPRETTPAATEPVARVSEPVVPGDHTAEGIGAAEHVADNSTEIEFEALADLDVTPGDSSEPAAQPLPVGQEVETQSRTPLISEQAGRQVAAAFGELSEAFAASRRRSFDEMAEEMLRPMLQDWLDNNLPHLVERLVREEIERIARG